MEAQIAQDAQNSLIASLQRLMYFHGKISVALVNSLLKVDGDFLIQLVDKASNIKTKELIGGGFLPVLSVKHAGKIRHWLIKQEEDRFGIEQAVFPSISSMIYFHLETRRSIVEGETVLIKKAVFEESEEVQECDEEAFPELPSLNEENNANFAKVSSRNCSAEMLTAYEVASDPVSDKLCGEAVSDGSSSGLAVNTSSSLDMTASVFRCLGFGISDSEPGSSIVNIDSNANNPSASVNNSCQSNDEGVRRCKSAPAEIHFLRASSEDAMVVNKTFVPSPQPVDSSVERQSLSDPSACTTGTWPSLRLFKSNQTKSAKVGKTTMDTTNPCAASNSSGKTMTLSTVELENGSGRNLGDDRNLRSVYFAIPELKPSCGTFESVTTGSAKYRCAACTPSLSLNYGSVDKLEFRYNVAKASTFYEFVRLYTVSNKAAVPSMSTMLRLAEILFEDYKQHVDDSLQLGSNA